MQMEPIRFCLFSFKNVEWPHPDFCDSLTSKGAARSLKLFSFSSKIFLDRVCIIWQRNTKKETERQRRPKEKEETTETPIQQSHSRKHFPHFIRNAEISSNFPDPNPLDYCIWGLLKEQVKKYGLITTFGRLEKILQKEWRAIPQQAIHNSVDSWMSRVRKVEQAGGGHIE